jgi:hypothetical protein
LKQVVLVATCGGQISELFSKEGAKMSTEKPPVLEVAVPTSEPDELTGESEVDSPCIHSQDFGALVDNVVEIEVDLRKQQELERLGRLASQD